MSGSRRWWTVGSNLGLLLLSAALLTLALPSELVPEGWGWLGWIALTPMFALTRRCSWWGAALAGLGWVVCFYLGAFFWLASFHPLALPLVLVCIAPQYALVFAVSALLWKAFPRHGFWLQACLWSAFEFLRLQGFLAFPYGALATTQYAYPLLFQSADLVGTTGLTFLMAAVSAWLTTLRLPVRETLHSWGVSGLILGLLGLANLGYGWVQLAQPQKGLAWRPALVQQVADPWQGGPVAYQASLDRLIALSRQALAQHPDAVIWSETAFVPSVFYHSRYRDTPESYQLVRRLEAFLQTTSVPFVIGNDHREKQAGAGGQWVRVDYNAALLWNRGWQGVYRKNRLVPFTEFFPYAAVLPWLDQALKAADTHFWQPGTERTVLQAGALRLGTPICYEDAFADLSQSFVAQGARVLVNLTNDSWAAGQASRRQHFAAAVFRAVENRVPLVCAGNDGLTAAVSPKGQIVAQLPIGQPGVLVAEVTLGAGTPTVYARWGEALAWLLVGVTGGALIGGLVIRVKKKRNAIIVDNSSIL